MKALLGHCIPQDLLNCDKFLTISLGYFAASLRLFNSSIWLDTFEAQSALLGKLSGDVDDIAACLLFNARSGFYDEPKKIQSLFLQSLRGSASNSNSHLEAKAKKTRQILNHLHALVQHYSQGSNISMTGFQLQATTLVSFSVMPQLNVELVSSKLTP